MLLQRCGCYGLMKKTVFSGKIFFLLCCGGGSKEIAPTHAVFFKIWPTVFFLDFDNFLPVLMWWGGVKEGGDGPICVCHTWGISSGWGKSKFQKVFKFL